MVIVGVVLIIFGVTLLIVVDAPRRIVATFSRRRSHPVGIGPSTTPAAPTPGRAVPSNSAVTLSPPAATPAGIAAAAVPAERADPWHAYRTLAPGWYRESSVPVARYWDGSTLHDEVRTVLSAPPPAAAHNAPGVYQGLPPGWYRDDVEPSVARFWDGRALGEERRPVPR